MKTCTKCGVEKDKTEFRFRNKAAGTRRADCRSCHREQGRKWREENRDKIREQKREYYKSNREKVREYREANRDKILKRQREHHKAHRDRILEKQREWYENNREYALEYAREYREANREKRLEYSRKWREKNPDKAREIKRRRRARKANCEGPNFTEADVRDRQAQQHAKCIVCLTSITIDTLHRDHRVSLARGGNNSRENLWLLCAPCNRSKNAKDPIDFAQERGFLIL